MPTTILGLDIGGANLKAATHDKRAVSVPFPLWKQPDKLPAALAELVAKFPDAEELAVTMTGELCDCFETKREGVAAILAAVRFASGGRRIRVWSTDGVFVDSEEAKRNHLKVAAANWHALATFVGQSIAGTPAILIDIGSTTTDVVPILHGKSWSRGKDDRKRLEASELVYTGARRTPVCALLGSQVAAEFFATAHDAYLVLNKLPEDPTDSDTADGRPATIAFAHARLARMLGADTETVGVERTRSLAEDVQDKQIQLIEYGITQAGGTLGSSLRRTYLANRIQFFLSGSGEFIARELFTRGFVLDRHHVSLDDVHSLTDKLGPAVSACAPAYAVAVLATEQC